MPAVTAAYSGFVNGTTRRIADHPADVLDHGATSTSPVGSYPSRARARSTPNYTISYAPAVGPGRPGAAGGHRLVGLDHLRRRGADHQPDVLGLRER